MAKLRLNGFCPKSELEAFASLHTEKISNDSEKALELLGNRTQSLVYPTCADDHQQFGNGTG